MDSFTHRYRDTLGSLIACLVMGAVGLWLLAGCGGVDTTTSGNLLGAADGALPTLVAGVDANPDDAPHIADAVAAADATTNTTADAPPVAISDQDHSPAHPLDETVNILLLGSDRRPDTPNWRTDVMMLIALDLDNGRAGIISLPRDIYVDDIPGHKPNRMNVIDYLGEQDQPEGGPTLMADILARDMGVHVDHYLRFEFESFRAVVDALGGVELDVDCEFRGYIEDEGGWLVLEPGPHRLQGNQALIYVRDRALTGGDLERARRQQRFVWAVRNQVLNQNLIGRVPALYSALSDAVETDIGLVKTLQFARFALGLDPDQLYGMVVGPPEFMQEGWRDGMAVFVPDWGAVREGVQTIFTQPPFLDENTPVECLTTS